MSDLQLPDTLFIGLFLDAMVVVCHCGAIIQHLVKGVNMPQDGLSIAVYGNYSWRNDHGPFTRSFRVSSSEEQLQATLRS